MHGKMVYNSYGTGKTWIFEDLDSISDSREDLDTVFRENLGIQVYPYDQCTCSSLIYRLGRLAMGNNQNSNSSISTGTMLRKHSVIHNSCHQEKMLPRTYFTKGDDGQKKA